MAETASGAVPVSVAQLCEWSTDASAATAFSPLTGQGWLLFDAATAAPTDAASRRLCAWLRALPCPVIAVAGSANELAAAADAVVDSTAKALRWIRRIRRHPLAATVLVQTLRAVEHLPLADALNVESLAYATLQSGPEFRHWRATHPVSTRAPAPAAGGASAVTIAREGGRLCLELNRPETHNAMTGEMRDALCEALQLAVTDDSVSSVEIGARGGCFSTGGDPDEFGSSPDPATAHIVRSLALPGRLLARCAEKATVHVHGACIGSGIEFPAFAGRVVASANAWFQLPELNYGLMPGAGGTVGISRRIGRQRTAWLALGGRRIDARTALAWGLVDALR